MALADRLAQGRVGLDHIGVRGRQTAGQPALQQGAAHLATADQEERPGEARHQASPSVSSIAAVSASCGDLPPQITNWNAG